MGNLGVLGRAGVVRQFGETPQKKTENMKIRFIITILLVFTNNIFSQEKIIKLNENEIITVDYSENGKVENGVYVCDKFEWKIKIPENYTISKTKELEETEAKGNAELKKNLPVGSKLQKRIHLIAFELNSNNTFSASLNSLENTKKMSLEEHKKFTVDLLKQSFGQIKNARFEFKTFDIRIGKFKFYKVIVEGFNASNNKLVLSQIYYNSYIKNQLFGVLISYNNEKEGKMLEDNFLSSLNNK